MCTHRRSYETVFQKRTIHCLITCIFSSPKLKSQVGFSDHLLSVFYPSICRFVCLIFTFFTSQEPCALVQFQVNLALYIFWWMRFNFIQMKGCAFFQGEMIVNIIFCCITTVPFPTKLGSKHPWVKGIVVVPFFLRGALFVFSAPRVIFFFRVPIFLNIPPPPPDFVNKWYWLNFCRWQVPHICFWIINQSKLWLPVWILINWKCLILRSFDKSAKKILKKNLV